MKFNNMIHIRFNTKFASNESSYEWRVIKDDLEFLVNFIDISVPCHTSSKYIDGVGIKYHITAESKDLTIEEAEGKRIAIIK
jgi:hypothetical protein